jgi:outer membrane protein assembly factor BamD (BamD/ComL family)
VTTERAQEFVHNGGPTQEALYAFVAGRLQAEAATWIGSHVRHCARCSSLVARIDGVHAALEPPAEPPFRRQADITAVRRRLERKQDPRQRLAVLMLAAGAAGFALMLCLTPRPVLAPLAARLEVGNIPCTLLARQGGADVEVGDEHASAQAKMALPLGGALEVQPDSRVVARWGGARLIVDGGASGARVRLESSRSDERRLRLERGRVLVDVDPLPKGAQLVVVTGDARVSVHGTRFYVDASAAGTDVAVDRGLVRVLTGGRSIDVPAGSELMPASAQAAALSPEARRAISLFDTSVLGDAASETLDVFADVPGARVSVDGADEGRAPLSLAVTPGAHLVHVRADGRLPVEERVDVVAGMPTLFHAELPELPSAPSEDGEPNPTASAALKPRSHAPSPSSAMAQARAEVLAGNYDRAIARLEALRRTELSPVHAARAALLEAQALRLQRRPERALPLLEDVARGRGPEAEQGQFLLAQTLGRDLRDPERAAEAWAAAQRRFPQGIFAEEIAFRLGAALLGSGETRPGVDALERYLRGFPTGAHAADAHLMVAMARRDRLNDCAGAIPHLRAAAESGGPRGELGLIGAARCLRSLARYEEARAVYLKYLQQSPQGRYADEARMASGTAKLSR